MENGIVFNVCLYSHTKLNRGPQALRAPEYQRHHTSFLSKGLIFVYQQPHLRINENQLWYQKAAS